MELKDPVRLIGAVDDIGGVQVRVGVEYACVTVWAPMPGGNIFDDHKFAELMEYLQQAYEDETRKFYAETEAEDQQEKDHPADVVHVWRGGITE